MCHLLVLKKFYTEFFMYYHNLKELFENSHSSRLYYLSLPMHLQMQVSEQGDFIHTAADLHETVQKIESNNYAVAVSEELDFFFGKSDRFPQYPME